MITLRSYFAWNFVDIYLVIISILLTQNFVCINRKLHNNRRLKSPQFWNELWCAYKVSVDMVERTNKLNGGTILISFFSNLYFTCVQLLGCFKSEASLFDGLYLWFSLIFLIGRTLAVCWYASQINDESKKPLNVLRSIHSDYFDVTMKRFTEQLVSGKVALSGMNFFYLTRKLILSVSFLDRIVNFLPNFSFISC
jgi:gustatory receptor